MFPEKHGPIKNEDAHLEMVYRETGNQLRCRRANQFCSIEEGTPQGDGQPQSSETQKQQPSGNGQQKQEQRSPPKPSQSGEVYDFDPDKDSIDILEDIISNPVHGLDQDQIDEVMSWGDIYDGQIPPGQLQQILENLKGVSKQRAQLIKQKYEAKLNKWMRDQSDNSVGPSLGLPSGHSQPNQAGGPAPSPQQMKQKKRQRKKQRQAQQKKQKRRRKSKGRDRRKERRQDAIDKAADEFAYKFAQNMAEDAGTIFNDARDILTTVFKQKAKNDPEWFIEKSEKWDMSLLDTMMEKSEGKKQQEEQESAPEVDMEIDNALDEVMQDEPSNNEPATSAQPEPEPKPTQPTTEDNPMKSRPQQEDVLEEPADEKPAEEFDDELETMVEKMEG